MRDKLDHITMTNVSLSSKACEHIEMKINVNGKPTLKIFLIFSVSVCFFFMKLIIIITLPLKTNL